RRRYAEVTVGRLGRDPSTRGASEQAALDEEGLVHLLERRAVFSYGCGERVEPNWPPYELLDDRAEYRPVTAVEADVVDAERLECGLGASHGDGLLACHLGVISHPAQQPLGDAHGAARASADLQGRFVVEVITESFCVPGHTDRQLLPVVVLEVLDDAEAAPQRTGYQAGPRGSAYERETRQLEPYRAGCGTLPENDVDLELFHGGVEVLLGNPAQPMDLVDEQHVALFEGVRHYGGEVARLLDGWSRGDPDANTHLMGDYVREG